MLWWLYIILGNTNKVIVSLIENEEEKIEKIKYIGEFDLYDIVCFTPFGLYLQKNKINNDEE